MMDHLFHLEIAFESSSVMILHPPRWKYRRAVTDWSGACKSQEEKKLLPGQFRNYLQTVHQLFNHKGLTLSSAYDAHVLRGFLAMILSPSPDASKLFFGLIHICFARYINLKNNIDLLRDLFYIVRHY